MTSAGSNDTEVFEASVHCKVFCQWLRRVRDPSIPFYYLATPADSKLIEKTLKGRNRIESLSVEGPMNRIQGGRVVLPEAFHWECLEHFLQHATLQKVTLCGALPRDFCLAAARNDRVGCLCVKLSRPLSAASLSKFLVLVRSSELELHRYAHVRVDSKALQLLGSSLKGNIFLRKLIVDGSCGRGKSVTLVLLQNLPHCLESLCVKNMELDFSGSRSERSLFDAIGELPHLKTLDLLTSDTKGDGFLRYLSATTVLGCLKLKVGCHELLFDVCERVIVNPSIKSLEFNFDTTFTEQAVVLNTFLKQSVYLKSLKLCGRPVDGSLLIGLISSLEMNTTLEALEVRVCSAVDVRLLFAALQRLKGLRVLTITQDTWGLNREGVAEDVLSSLELNLSLFEVRGGVFEAGRQQHRGRIDKILCRNRHLADAQKGDRLPTDLWPRFLESSLRNSEVGASFVYEYLRKDLTWAHK